MFQGVLTQRDYVRSQFLHMRPRRAFAVIGVFLLLLFAAAVVIGDGAIPLLALLAFLGLQFFVYVPWRSRRAFNQYKALSEPVSITLREDGLYFARAHGSGLLPWSQIRKWKASSDLILLYPADHIFHLVPRHFFASDLDFLNFRATLQARIGRDAA
jgi:hypothetical protein